MHSDNLVNRTFTNPLLMIFGFLVMHDLLIIGSITFTRDFDRMMLGGTSETYKDWAVVLSQTFARGWMGIIAILLIMRLGLFHSLGLVTPFAQWLRKPALYLFLAASFVVQVGFSNIWLGLSSYSSSLVLFSMIGDMAIGFEEELWFRGVVFLVLLRGWAYLWGDDRRAVIFAIFVSAALFGLWHMSNYVFGQPLPQTVMQVIYTFLLGIIFACLYIISGSIWVPIIGHGVFDFGVNMSIVFNRSSEEMGTGAGSDQTFAEAFAAYGGFIALVAVIAVLSLRYVASIEPQLRDETGLS